MNKSFLLLLTLLLSLIFVCTAGGAGEKAHPTTLQKDLHEITIFYANDVRGETEPCG